MLNTKDKLIETLNFKTNDDIKKFWYSLENYLNSQVNFSKYFKMNKPNQNWVNIYFSPFIKNKEPHIVLRILKQKKIFKIEYYIDNDKKFFEYLNEKQDITTYFQKENIQRNQCSKFYKESNFENFHSQIDIFKWYSKEILNIYNIFSSYLFEVK